MRSVSPFDEIFEEKLTKKRLRGAEFNASRKSRHYESKRVRNVEKPVANVVFIKGCPQIQRVELVMRDRDEKMQEDFLEFTKMEDQMEIINSNCIQETKRFKKKLSLKSCNCQREPKDAPETKRRGVDQMHPWPVPTCLKIKAKIEEICNRLTFLSI